MTTRQTLEAARELIRNKRDWFGGDEPARRGNQECAVLACRKVTRSGGWHAINALAGVLGYRGYGCLQVVIWNNSHTHAEVLELFNLAIADEIAREEAHSRHMVEEAEREAVEDPAAPLVFA